jgi:hypothetical protein
MKIAVIGHTNGIGKAIFEYLSQEHEVRGFSLTNGYDINSKESRDRISKAVIDYDVFINNAYSFTDNNQLNMLKEICEIWNHDPLKIVFNVSSQYIEDDIQYCRDKKQLDDFCDSLMYNKMKLINLKPGLTHTRHNIDNPKPKMPVSDIVKVVEFCLDNIESFTIKSISFGR